MRPLLLDTCALLLMDDGSRLKPEAEAALQTAQREGTGAYVSPITAWELGMLVAKERIVLAAPPLQWFEAALETGIELAVLTPTILTMSSFLPGSKLRDPADRILAATARALDLQLVTRDAPLLEYAAAGHLRAIGC